MSSDSLAFIIIGIAVFSVGIFYSDPTRFKSYIKRTHKRFAVKTDEVALNTCLKANQKIYIFITVLGVALIIIGILL